MKALIKKGFNAIGLDICKYISPEQIKDNQDIDLMKSNQWLRNLGIKQIIDIGANEGQFAKKMRGLFPDISIISFEPLVSPYATLIEEFKGDINFKGYNLGIGDVKQDVEIFSNDYSPSSSMLPMLETHKFNFPHTKNAVKNLIKIDKLDSVLNYEDLAVPLLIKIDVQGFEDKVILGGTKIIEKAEVILIELTYSYLYENQPLFDDIYQMLRNLGFSYKGNYEQLYSPKDNSILQSDGIFIKN